MLSQNHIKSTATDGSQLQMRYMEISRYILSVK